MKRRGLTIVELLVVFAILSVLMALLLPAVHSARERARETVCKNKLHQINLAIAQFAEVQKELPSPTTPDLVGGWMVAILPFVEEQNLKDTIPRGLLVTNVNQTLFRPPSVFRCPRRTTIDGDSLQSIWPGHYVFVPASGRESFFVFDAPVELTVPWVIGPEMVYDKIVRKKGPHSDGFHFARGFQQGVSFMLNREEMR